jgi:hypothetical protein
MMGQQTGDQSQLFYLFNLERRIPSGHLPRRINPVVTRMLADLREELAPFYSEIGRLSLSQTLSGSQLTENRVMLLQDEGPFQAHWLDGRRSGPVAGGA